MLPETGPAIRRACVRNAPEPLFLDQPEPGLRNRLLEARHRRQHTARKNVTLDEVGLPDIFVEGVVFDRDGLKHRPPAIFQQRGNGPK